VKLTTLKQIISILHDLILLAKPFIGVTSESTVVVEFIRNVIESNDLHSAIPVTRWTVRAVMKKTWKVHNMKENGKKKEKKLAGRNMDDNEMDDNMDDKANMSDQGYDVNAIHIGTHNALKPDEEMVVTLVRIQSIQGSPRKQKRVIYCY
jgi:hypothetical protein